MVKYMRKAKTAGDTAAMEKSQSSLGVRTRARTLALQRLHQSTAAAPPEENPDSYYLELRSRRLEKKPPLPRQSNLRKGRRGCVCGVQENSEDRTREEWCEAALISRTIEAVGLEIEASFGENCFGTVSKDSRNTRKSTPSSSNRAATSPRSSTKSTRSSTRSQRLPLNAVFINMPTQLELEEFFAVEEQSMQHHFVEKYNFDFMKDSPLSGRYEWAKENP